MLKQRLYSFISNSTSWWTGHIGLSDERSDQEIWRRAQKDRLLLITHNRNREDETSLQATIETETGPGSLPVLTIPNIEKLARADYRQQAAHKL
jgi:predicted nuclease of predicted toxin-antitoxin system